MRIFDLLLKKYFCIAATAALLTACVDKDPDEFDPYAPASAKISTQWVGYADGELTLSTLGNPKYTWNAAITKGEDWCSLSRKSGKVASDTAIVFYKQNTGESVREAHITVNFNDPQAPEVILVLTQGYAGEPHAWAELPAEVSDNPAYIHKTYYTTLSNGVTVRNYSVCFDTETKVSRWVAYPVHTIYTSGRDYTVGGTTRGRTNAWAFDDAVTKYKESSNYNTAYSFISVYDSTLDAYDTYTMPIIPQKYQQDIVSSAYNDNKQGVKNLNRGHMLPSASRYNSWTTNAQTFYATNMMPQFGYFNSGVWGKVEEKTRETNCNDTLYVVVGTLFEDGAQVITSKNRDITVPTHCYKLLLRTKSGNTNLSISDIKDPDQLQAIAFIYENKNDYPNPQNQSDAQIKAMMLEGVCSVSEIEERSGFKFFNLIDPQIADQVKSKADINDWPKFK